MFSLRTYVLAAISRESQERERKVKTQKEDLAIVVDGLVDLDDFRHHAREIQFVHGLHRVCVLFSAPRCLVPLCCLVLLIV